MKHEIPIGGKHGQARTIACNLLCFLANTSVQSSFFSDSNNNSLTCIVCFFEPVQITLNGTT